MLRFLLRDKLNSLIDVASLSLAMASRLVLGLYLRSELTYDRHHVNHERIYRVETEFVAAEVVRGLRGTPGLTARAPWLVAFVFGLLHGFGFAGALAEVGLPPKAIPVALFTFNVGVELGQLLFVAAVVTVVALCARLPARMPRWSAWAPRYAIGTIAMFWVAERVVSFRPRSSRSTCGSSCSRKVHGEYMKRAYSLAGGRAEFRC